MGARLVSVDALTTPVGAGGQLSMLDKKLLRYASRRLTLEQMSQKLGSILTPAECGQRVREILQSWDWMSIVEQKALILMDMIELKEILFDRVRREGGVVEDSEGRVSYSFGDPRWAGALTKVLEQMSKLIDSTQVVVEADRNALRREHALVMGRALELTLSAVLQGLQEQHPQIDELEARAQLEMALPRAIQFIEGHVNEDERADEDETVGF